MSTQAGRGRIGALLIVWSCIAAATLAVAIPRIEDPGLYYDEAFLAQQARDFVEPSRAGVHPPSVETAYVAGRPFPIRNAIYLGSLKSQLLIPSLATFGSSPFVLRVTTLVTALLALLGFMLWARQIFDTKIAVAMGIIAASDPAFHFFGQFEWGPFTTLLLCRGFGFWLLGVAFQATNATLRVVSYALAGIILGLGIYSRADFAVILFAAALALVLCRRELLRDAWQQQRSGLIAAGAGLFVAASPIFWAIPQLFGAGSGISDRGDLFYRARVLWSTLDGTHFHRLMETGGLFDELFSISVPATALAVACIGSAVILINSMRHTRSKDARAFVLVMLAAIAVCMVALPGAVRGHHMLNAFPLPHLVIAAAGVNIWGHDFRDAKLSLVARSAVVATGLILLVSNGLAIDHTREFIRETGGKGRWSRSLTEFALSLDAQSDAETLRLVSLDWGFHEPLLFLTDHLKLREPIWRAASAMATRTRITIRGDTNSIYLLQPRRFEVAPLGRAFASALEKIDSDRYETEHHRNRVGEIAFTTVRFRLDPNMIYDGSMRILFFD